MKLKRIRQVEAQQRAAARAKRSPEQQLKLLDSKPGASKRERERLNEMLTIKAAESVKLVTHDDETPKPTKKPRRPRS